jgi:protein-disulfide isomerase
MPRLRLLPALALALALPAQASAQSDMTDAERAALHAEIRAFLLENPEILREMVSLLEAEEAERTAETDRALIAEHAETIFEDGYSYVGGNPEGSVTLVEFTDYQCGFCRRAHDGVNAMVEEDGDIRLVVKEFPILGPGSELAARAAIATLITEGGEAYARLNDLLMRSEGQVTEASLGHALEQAGLDADAIRATMQDPEVTRRIEETRGLAQMLGVAGTPTYVLGDRMIRGFVPRPEMESLIAEERAEG